MATALENESVKFADNSRGTAQGTIVRTKNIVSKTVRSGIPFYPPGHMHVVFDIYNCVGQHVSNVAINFPRDIENGKHFFTANGPISNITYYATFDDDNYFNLTGVKDGKGYVDIKYVREEVTGEHSLTVQIVNVHFPTEESEEEVVINLAGKVEDLALD